MSGVVNVGVVNVVQSFQDFIFQGFQRDELLYPLYDNSNLNMKHISIKKNLQFQ